ncbi:MAG: ABC transporter permease [Chloroflexi bacterium]|nr:ABC transporter permease [Chloroflexota bacterium]MDA1146874.1 ABC transporter permease [Chloroflexota bacterium]
MSQYILRRLLLNVVVLWFVASLVFFASNLLPGDFAQRQVATNLELADYSEAIEEARHILGLDKPLWRRYVDFMADTATLDLGTSYDTGRSTWSELGRRLPTTLELGTLIIFVSFALSIPIGVVSAVKQDTWIDYLLRGFSILGVASPVFFIAILMTLVVLKFDLFRIDIVGEPHFWTDPIGAAKLYLIPTIAGGVAGGAGIMRLLRSQMLEVMRNDYIRTARAKGLRERTVWVNHAMKNAALPVLTVMGLTIANVVSGQIILENMFNIDGVGRFLFTRLILRDFPPFQGAVLVIAFVIVTTNLVVDVIYGWLDPRIRFT